MGCTGRYSEARYFAAFWCVDQLFVGVDNSGGAANAFLTDSGRTFLGHGIEPNQGMVLYNTTQDTSGPVTAVDTHTLTATGVTWDDGDAYWIVAITGSQIALIEHQLDVTASNIHAALASVGACDCTLADWAAAFLGKLNIIEAGVIYRCPCQMTLSAEEKTMWLEWLNTSLELIRNGEIDVCSGATGSLFPARAFAEQAVSEFNAARIIINYGLRNQ